MQVYKTFMKVAQAKLPSIILYFIVFFLITLIMSFTMQDEINKKFETASAEICIIDEDQSTASHALSDYLSVKHTLVTFDSYDNETLQDNLYYQRIDYVLTIPVGFEEELLSGKNGTLVQSAKQPDSASGYFIDQQINGYIHALSVSMTGGNSLEDAIVSVNETFSVLPEVTVTQFDKKSSDMHTQIYYFFQYLPYVMLMMVIEGLTPVLLAFHKKDVEERILCSSTKQSTQSIQIGLGCATFSLVIWLAFMLLSIFIYGPQQVFSLNGLLCILNSMVFVLIATAITLFLGTFSLNSNALNMIANVIGLGMSFLCGVFVPQWFLGDAVLSFSRFLPTYWYIRITNMLAGFSDEALSMDTYWTCIGIQMLFSVAIFAVYLASSRFHRRAKEG